MYTPSELNAAFAPLVRRIEAEATIIGDQILKIDHFLNHRIEPAFIAELGRERVAGPGPEVPARR